MTLEIVLQSVVSGLMFGGVIALVAVGISLIWGVMDVINFAYGEYLMWAMYLTFFLSAGAGLDPAEAETWLDNANARDAVAAEDARARELGIQGVPFFIFGGRVAVSGAQPAEVLLDAMKQAESVPSEA